MVWCWCSAGWLILDPLIALAVAANIVWIAFRLLRESGYGLLDSALPAEDRQLIDAILERYRTSGIAFHALRTRLSGTRRFISLHVLVPGSWTVQRGHDLCEEIELAVLRALPESSVFTHLEPREDPRRLPTKDLIGPHLLPGPHPRPLSRRKRRERASPRYLFPRACASARERVGVRAQGLHNSILYT